MRRVATMAYCIACLLAWLMYEPFFHAHEAEDGGEIHAHFDLEVAEEDHHEHSEGPEFDHPIDGHHGVDTSAFAGETPPPRVPLVEIGATFSLIDPLVLQGTVIEQPVRVHDPPARVSSSPRSPPA
jgi:hypothetical protein